MRRFVLGWKRRGVEDRLQARILSYADDYVICCKGDVDEALAEMREMMRRLKLTINEAKTRVCHLPEERFDFLGYTFGRYYSIHSYNEPVDKPDMVPWLFAWRVKLKIVDFTRIPPVSQRHGPPRLV
jgi:hypothetical protein